MVRKIDLLVDIPIDGEVEEGLRVRACKVYLIAGCGEFVISVRV